MAALYSIITSFLLLVSQVKSIGCLQNSKENLNSPKTKEKTLENRESKDESIPLDKNRIKLAETYFLKFMGVDRKPHKHIIKKIKVPEHMWKLYYKWSNTTRREERGKEKPDTARIFFENG